MAGGPRMPDGPHGRAVPPAADPGVYCGEEDGVEIKRVEGRDRGRIMVYALSTCMWCRKAKNLLDRLGVAYSFVDVDLLDAADKEAVKAEVKRWNPSCSYPTIVIGEARCIAGFDEAEIRQAVADG